jgi:hypothetical protein
VIGLSVQRVNVEPVSLQPSRVASKKLLPPKVQPTNAVASCTDALNRQRSKTQSSNVAPFVLASVRSTSTNRTRSWRTSASSSPYQSSPRISVVTP